MSVDSSDNATLEDEFQLYLQTDSAQKTPRSASGDAYFLGVALHFFNVERQKTLIWQIRLEDLQLFQLWLAKAQKIGSKTKEPWGDTTIEFYTRILKKFFRKMHDTDRIAKDPCRLWKVPRGTASERRPMTRDEFEKLYSAAPEWFKPIAKFVRLTGARGASVAMLTWADIDFEKRQLFLKSRKGGLKQMKTIPFFIYDELMELLETESWKVPNAAGPVFWGPKGTAVTAQEISSEGSRLIRKVLGIKDRTLVFYGNRHAIGMELAEAGVSLEVARQIMGHSSVAQTSHYSKKIASSVLGDALNKIRGKDGK